MPIYLPKQTTTLTGDVTGSGVDNVTTTIAQNAVTYDKMQNVSQGARILGRVSGVGDPEEITLSQALDFVGSAAQGDILYRGASSWTRLAAGTAGRYLQTAGTGGAPAWAFNYAFKNIIINGDMQVAQRNTSVAGIVASGYNTADRWRTDLTSCGTWTQAVVADAPTGTPFCNSLRMTVTTAKTPAASDICRIDQRFEGQNLLGMLKGSSNARPLTLSFWVKGSIAGTYIAELCDNNNTRQVSASYQIAVANTWEFKTITFPADTTGTLTNDNNYSLCVGFWLAAGPNFRSGSLQTSWGNTAGNRAVGQVSVSATVSATWQITGAQLEYGAVATDFECLPFHLQETLCERYLPRAAISNRTAPTNGQENFFGGASPFANVGLVLFNFSTKARRDPTGVVLTLGDFSIYDLLSGNYGPLTAAARVSGGFVNTTVAFTADNVLGGPLNFTQGGVVFLAPNAGAPTRNIIFNGCEL